jgi:threonylcarbamoyladenosine tRNA methylthiotransferase MtaB
MNHGTKFAIRTLGCRCNQADSAAIRDCLCRCSMREVDTHQDADLVVVNTCTVTHRADREARRLVRRLHRENPAAHLILTGCYAQRDPDTLAAMAGASLVLGNADKFRLPEILEKCGVSANGSQKAELGKPLAACRTDPSFGSSGAGPCSCRIIRRPLDSKDYCPSPPMARTGGKTRPLVKLQDGCDARCSYCIVPLVRGPGRSARPEYVLSEIQSLAEQGFQEIVLTGIDLGAYGRKHKGHARLVDLLRRIVEIPRLGRIRLSSIEPMFFDREIVGLAAGNPVFARHFHIPVQSGSNRILKLMRRPYTAKRFRDLLQFIQSELPDAGLGTDVLVGFPGETDRDFGETCRLLEDSPLAYLHVFPFSPREGTEACFMPGRIPTHVMKQRMREVLEIARGKNLSFRRRFIGKILPAVTLAGEEGSGAASVLTGNYIHARVPGLSVEPNRLVEICIQDVLPDATYAGVECVNS